MKTITSTQNPEIKDIQQLHTKKGRTQHQKFIAQGIRTCTTLLQAGYVPTAVYVLEEQAHELHGNVSPSLITLVNQAVLEKISTSTTPSGPVCVFAIPKQSAPTALTRGLVLANVTDPGNMGTLIRSCAAFGFKTVVVVDGCDVWNPKVIQATAGTIGLVHIFEYTWHELVQHKKDLNLCALVVHGGNSPEQITHQHILLVVGNEAHGLPQEWINDCEQKMTLPMPGNVESLNAAVAGSLALYTLIKQ